MNESYFIELSFYKNGECVGTKCIEAIRLEDFRAEIDISKYDKCVISGHYSYFSESESEQLSDSDVEFKI